MLDYRHEVLGVRLLALLPHLALTHLGRVSFVGFVFQDFCISKILCICVICVCSFAICISSHLPLTHLGRVSFVGFVFQDFLYICISLQRFSVFVLFAFAVLHFVFLFAFPPTMIGGLLPPALCPSSLSSMVAGSSGIVKLCKEDALETFKDLMLWL